MTTKKSVSFSGEVVESLFMDGKRRVKIRLDSHLLELPIGSRDMSNLGDKLLLEGELIITQIKPILTPNIPEPPD